MGNKRCWGMVCLLVAGARVACADVTVLTNQIGYDVRGAKRAVVRGETGDEVSDFKLIEGGTGKEVMAGKAVSVGRVDHWKEWVFWTVDFSSVSAEGNYVVTCNTNHGEVRSFPFLIERDLLERRTLSDVAYYFKDQRVVGKLEEEDRRLGFEDSTDPKKVLDLHGGWADATGDSGKHLSHLNFANYFNPQHGPLTTWALFYAADELGKRKMLGNVRRRMIDEAYYGADYLYRSKNPNGSFYRSVDDGNPRFVAKDGSGGIFGKMEIQNPLQKGDVTKISGDFLYEVGFRCGGAMSIAGLAAAASHKGHGEYSHDQYLRAAEDGYAFLSKNDNVYSHDGKNNIIDDYCVLMAATELFKATGKEAYKAEAEGRAKSLMGRWVEEGAVGGYWRADDGDRPFFHASDAGLPVVALLNYWEIAEQGTQKDILATVRKAMEGEMRRTDSVANPFGYARQLVQTKSGERREAFFFPHDSDVAPWWQGENARLGSLAAAARMAASHFVEDKTFHGRLEAYASDQLNWVLGCNPYDVCMLHGSGRNSSEYTRGGYDYIGAPGGICNGITSALNDPQGIGFNERTDSKDDESWRWNEQWLPHSTWFMTAVATGE